MFMICFCSDSNLSSICGSCTIFVGVPDILIDSTPISGLLNEEVSKEHVSLQRSTNHLGVV